VIFAAALGTATSAFAQGKPASPERWFAQLPFDEWMKQGPSRQLPFKTHGEVLGLAVQQRLVARIEARIDGAELVARGNHGTLVALVQLTDRSGQQFRNAAELSLDTLKPEARRTEITVSWTLFVRPGEYSVQLALYHTETKQHGLTQQSLRVPEAKKSFEADLWHDLPNIEFWGTSAPPDPDAAYLPDVEHDVHVPLRSDRPISLQIIVDVTASEAFEGSAELFSEYLFRVLPAMRVLANADVSGGSIRVSAIDLLHRRELFDQRNVHMLDWERFKRVFSPESVGTVDVASLNKKKSPVFLRQELSRRLQGEHEGERAPMKVFIVLTAPLSSYSFSGLQEPGALPDKCSCRVYYLEFGVVRQRIAAFGRRRLLIPYSAFGAKGDVEKMLRPLHVRSFEIEAMNPAESFGNALRKISEELAKQ